MPHPTSIRYWVFRVIISYNSCPGKAGSQSAPRQRERVRTRATRSHACPDPTAGNQVVVKETLRSLVFRFHSNVERARDISVPGQRKHDGFGNTAALTLKAAMHVGKGHFILGNCGHLRRRRLPCAGLPPYGPSNGDQGPGVMAPGPLALSALSHRIHMGVESWSK